MADAQIATPRIHHHKGKRFGKPFEKGRSGNAGGKPKIIKSAMEAAREHAPDLIPIAVAIAKNKNAPAAARVTAIGMVLDRAYGRAPQFNTNFNIEGRRPEELTDQELVQIIDGALRGPGEQLELLPEPIEPEPDGRGIASPALPTEEEDAGSPMDTGTSDDDGVNG